MFARSGLNLKNFFQKFHQSIDRKFDYGRKAQSRIKIMS
jgi:hypothetical protein